MTGIPPTPTQTPPPEPPQQGGPVRRFWEWFKQKREEENKKDAERLRSVARGATGAVVETAQATFEAGAVISRRTGLGELMTPGFNQAYDDAGGARGLVGDATDDLDAVRENFLGKRSDDRIAGFIEDTAQFMTSFLALGQLSVVGKAGQVTKLGLVARGALADATAFDPYEAQIAEWAARADIPGIDALAELLSVDGDDTAIVARLKRSTAGMALGSAMDGAIAVARIIRTVRAGKNLRSSSKEFKEMEAYIAQQEEVIERVRSGAGPEEGGVFSLDITPDGKATVMVGDVRGPTFDSVAEATAQTASMNRAHAASSRVPTVQSPQDAARIAAGIRERLQGAVDATGQVADETMEAIASETMGSLRPEEATRILTELSEDATIQSAVNKMAQGHSRNLGKRIAALDFIMTQRPHDIVAKQEAVELVKELLNFEDVRKWTVGEQGRALRLQRKDLMNPFEKEAEEVAEGAVPEPRSKVLSKDVPGTGPRKPTEAEQKAATRINEASAEVETLLAEINVNKADTDAVTATDFSLNRARERAKKILKLLEADDISTVHDPEAAQARAAKIKEGADAQRSDPLEVTPGEIAEASAVKTSNVNPIEELSRWIDRADEQLSSRLNKAAVPKEHKQKLFEEVSPILERIKRGTPAALLKAEQNLARTTKVAGMTTRTASKLAVNEANVRQITRMYRLAGGRPRDVEAAVQASNIIRATGKTEGVLELFVNSLLSNPATIKTVLFSGQAIQAYEALGHVVAGVFTRNKPLAQEGIDLIVGNYMHIVDNLRVARRALNEGQSIINPAPAHHAIGNWSGEGIRTPTNVLIAGDEFTRITNYRSRVRSKSLREGRAAGLSGDKLAAHVEADLVAAFDPETGIATIPEALQYAERSTLAGPLGINSIGGKLGEFIRETPGLQFLAPFTKTATNLYRFTTMHTPYLARLNAEARAIMAAGGEEAAVLQAKQAMASTIYMAGIYTAMAGNLTGDAPGDPRVRELWLKNHQPYSVKVGNKWISYRRTDPFGMMLGFAADYVQFAQQMDENDPELTQLAAAMISSLATGVLTPPYMKGMGDFLDALTDGEPAAVQRWMTQFSSSFVPAGLNAVNTDPYFRETRGLFDAFKNRTPGLSQTLDPKFDMFGEPQLNGGIGNRSALFRTKDFRPDAVEDELLTLGKGFSPFASKTPEGIDLTDRETFDNGTGVSPYRRMMEIIGSKNLRGQIEQLVKSERYQNSSGGTRDYPGGERWELVQRIRVKAQSQAIQQVMREYPLLREEMIRARRLNRNAFRGGEEGLRQAEEIFGPLQQSRPTRPSRLRQR